MFSFTRQFITIYLLRPLAYKLGVRKEAKVLRFLEQAYTFIYFSFSGAIGIWVMYQEPTWWYKTEHFWLGYPHGDMKPHIKLYYLLQTSYWLQQMLVLILGLEKPRKDFNELIMHVSITQQPSSFIKFHAQAYCNPLACPLELPHQPQHDWKCNFCDNGCFRYLPRCKLL